LKTDHCEERVLVLPKSSAEQLCQLILTEEVQTVICGGIEEEYYQYLTWKQVHILDSVIGDWHHVFQAFKEGRLKPADIIYNQVD
jgi:predicted Fe-Mo cluster-binding NifX family protein